MLEFNQKKKSERLEGEEKWPRGFRINQTVHTHTHTPPSSLTFPPRAPSRYLLVVVALGTASLDGQTSNRLSAIGQQGV